MNPIEMIGWFDGHGKLHPVRFYIETSIGEQLSIPIDSVENIKAENYVGNPMLAYHCYCTIHGVSKIYCVKYEILTCQWFICNNR